MADPELRHLLHDASQASETLVSRLEGYGGLVPSRPHELAVTDDIVRFARHLELQFRAWYERTRTCAKCSRTQTCGLRATKPAVLVYAVVSAQSDGFDPVSAAV